MQSMCAQDFSIYKLLHPDNTLVIKARLESQFLKFVQILPFRPETDMVRV